MDRIGRHRLALGAGLSALAALALASSCGGDWIVFNHSPSIPAGLYLRTGGAIEPGAVVTVRARDEAHRRQFEDASDRFIKRVAAVEGAHVCSDGHTLNINGVEVARTFEDAEAPRGWVGCRILTENEVLLLGETEDSFDGRYWGPISVSLIEGVWRRL